MAQLQIMFDLNYEEYADKHNLWDLLGLGKEPYGEIERKITLESCSRDS